MVLKAYVKINNYKTHVGYIETFKDEVVNFKFNSNAEILFLNEKFLPFKRTKYSIEYLDKFHEEYKFFNAFVKMQDSFKMGVKLTWIEKFKMNWIFKKYLIQSDDIKKDILKYMIGAVLGFIITSIVHRVNEI